MAPSTYLGAQTARLYERLYVKRLQPLGVRQPSVSLLQPDVQHLSVAHHFRHRPQLWVSPPIMRKRARSTTQGTHRQRAFAVSGPDAPGARSSSQPMGIIDLHYGLPNPEMLGSELRRHMFRPKHDAGKRDSIDCVRTNSRIRSGQRRRRHRAFCSGHSPTRSEPSTVRSLTRPNGESPPRAQSASPAPGPGTRR